MSAIFSDPNARPAWVGIEVGGEDECYNPTVKDQHSEHRPSDNDERVLTEPLTDIYVPPPLSSRLFPFSSTRVFPPEFDRFAAH